MTPSAPFATRVPPRAGNPRFVLRGLDGLRAVAVVLVVVYHLWPTSLPGGLIGVDLFFVISGYLITALLLREAAYTDRMHLPQFWMRRLRRLVPAMVACVLACTSIAFLVGGDVTVQLNRQVLGALTYTSNWTSIAAGNDYFRDTSPELLTNFWSLGVEEQFYLAWPVVLVLACMLLATWSRRRLVPLVLSVLSSLAMLVLFWATGDVSRVYYGLDTHAFGLMLGAALALLIPWSMYPPLPGLRVHAVEAAYSGGRNAGRILLGWASLVLLPLLARALDDAHPGLLFPWGLLAASLLGLGVIQALLPDVRGAGAEGLRRLLSWAPLTWIGKRSYGLYLWHWPIMVLLRAAAPGLGTTVRGCLVLVLTVAVAAVSYRWLENPVRRLGFLGALRAFAGNFRLRGARRWTAAGAVLLLVLGGTGTALACVRAPQMTEAEQVVAEGEAALQNEPTPSSTPTPTASGPSASASPSAPSGYQPSPDGRDVTIVGDSVTLASAAALQRHLPGTSIDAQVSRNVQAGLGVLQQKQSAGQLGRIVVVSLSTNSEMTQQSIDALTDLAEQGEPREIVLVTGEAPADKTWVSPSNDAIRAAAAKNPELVVADWQKAIQGHTDLLVSDGVHPQPQGQEIYASTVADAVASAKKDLQKRTAAGASATATAAAAG